MENKEQYDLNRLRESLEISLPLVQRVLPIDVMFGLADTEKFIYYLAGDEIDIRIQTGDDIPSRSGIKKALDANETFSANIGKEIYGTPFKSTSIPLEDEQGNTAGVFTVGISLKNQEILNQAAGYLATSSGEIRGVTDEIASTATDLANHIHTLKTLGQMVSTELKKTDEILSFIKQVADSSSLLSINASIEAAHAGEFGRGFGVVAKEIRKMSESSNSAAKQIEQILGDIQKSFTQLDLTLVECFAQSERQAAATEEIAASMQQLAVSAEDIKEIAKLI